MFSIRNINLNKLDFRFSFFVVQRKNSLTPSRKAAKEYEFTPHFLSCTVCF